MNKHELFNNLRDPRSMHMKKKFYGPPMSQKNRLIRGILASPIGFSVLIRPSYVNVRVEYASAQSVCVQTFSSLLCALTAQQVP